MSTIAEITALYLASMQNRPVTQREFDAHVDANESDVTALDGRLDTAESDITGLESADVTLATAVAARAKELFFQNKAVASVTNGLTTLLSYTLPGGTLVNDGDMVIIETEGVLLNDTDLKLDAITFGATVVATRSGVADQNLKRWSRAIVVRTGAATQLSHGLDMATGAGPIYTDATPAETLSGDIVIAYKGQNQTDSTNASVTSRYLRVTYVPVGTYTTS